MNRIYIILLIIASIIGVLPINAQLQLTSHMQSVDVSTSDSIDRTAEDFVIASLLIADPGTFMYSVLGHSAVRLQCPTFDLDYCYTYEAEDAPNKIWAFLSGRLMMGLYAIPTEYYCTPYREEGRGVYEYVINLPIDIKRELWKVLDVSLQEDKRVLYDYYHRGCAITIVDFVKVALGEVTIEYDRSLFENSRSVKEIWNQYTENALWIRFICYFIGAGKELECPIVGDKQLIIPTDLVNAWQKATVNGEPLLASEPIVLVEGKPQVNDGWFTPMVLAIILFVLSIVNLWVKYPYFDWLILGVQTLAGCCMTYLIFFSDLCCTSWNWLIIPFNPLPIICWKWRKYWALPYAGILVVWCVTMTAVTIFGHVLVDWSHIVMVIAWAMIVLKQSKLFVYKD